MNLSNVSITSGEDGVTVKCNACGFSKIFKKFDLNVIQKEWKHACKDGSPLLNRKERRKIQQGK